jgi:Bacterial DNA topoisomerase IB, N-terminal domain/CHC2 zinc finger
MAKTKPSLEAAPLEGSIESARAAGLRYVHDDQPDIRRVRRGKAFRYLDPNGRPVRDAETLARIRALVIPPAWTDVWICPHANGHLQATGRDARGRTFSVNLDANVFHCFDKTCGQKGDVIDLWASVKGLSLREAALDLVRTFGLEPAPRGGTEKRNG